MYITKTTGTKRFRIEFLWMKIMKRALFFVLILIFILLLLLVFNTISKLPVNYNWVNPIILLSVQALDNYSRVQ
jgi:hypothetical protein